MATSSRFAALLDAAREGHEPSWTEIYGAFSPQLLGFIRGQGVPDPEDVLGQVWLDIARNLAKFEGGEEQFRGWAFTVARNRVIDERRRLARRPTSNGQVPEEAAPADFEELSLGRESAVQVLEHLLSDIQRDVILLRFVADLSVAQTAEILGKREGAIKAIQHRAVQRLRKKIARPITKS